VCGRGAGETGTNTKLQSAVEPRRKKNEFRGLVKTKVHETANGSL